LASWSLVIGASGASGAIFIAEAKVEQVGV
jgi:hypothetical protein